jgi:hypothetical protein
LTRLPAAPSFVVPRVVAGGLLIPVLWTWLGAVAGVTTAVLVVAFYALFVPRALVLDEEGFRVLSLVPRRKVLWADVASFGTGAALRAGRFVQYTKAGRTPRWWYPAGWPAQGAVPPAFAPSRGKPALSAAELCKLLSDRLVRAASSAPAPS